MPPSSPETLTDKRFHKLRKKRRKKRAELNQLAAKPKHDTLQKKARLFSKSSMKGQPEKNVNTSDHEVLLRQQFGPKVTSKTRLTRPKALVSGMFAQGTQSMYVAREPMNEVTKAYLKEDLHHIIEMANPHKETASMKTHRRQSLAAPLRGLPVDKSCDEDDPSPVLPSRTNECSNTETRAALHGPRRMVHRSPELRFSPQHISTPDDTRGRKADVAPSHRGESRSGARLENRVRIVVPESSADSSSDEERWCGASDSPDCDLESFLAACNNGALSAQCNLTALSKHSGWSLQCQRKLQDVFKKSGWLTEALRGEN